MPASEAHQAFYPFFHKQQNSKRYAEDDRYENESQYSFRKPSREFSIRRLGNPIILIIEIVSVLCPNRFDIEGAQADYGMISVTHFARGTDIQFITS